MENEILTHEDAVEYLCQHGFYAKIRTWAPGKTVLILIGPSREIKVPTLKETSTGWKEGLHLAHNIKTNKYYIDNIKENDWYNVEGLFSDGTLKYLCDQIIDKYKKYSTIPTKDLEIGDWIHVCTEEDPIGTWVKITKITTSSREGKPFPEGYGIIYFGPNNRDHVCFLPEEEALRWNHINGKGPGGE